MDEAEDTLYTMDFAEKLSEFRAINTCLEVFNKDLNQYI
jgi:hypothetical protein